MNMAIDIHFLLGGRKRRRRKVYSKLGGGGGGRHARAVYIQYYHAFNQFDIQRHGCKGGSYFDDDFVILAVDGWLRLRIISLLGTPIPSTRLRRGSGGSSRIPSCARSRTPCRTSGPLRVSFKACSPHASVTCAGSHALNPTQAGCGNTLTRDMCDMPL